MTLSLDASVSSSVKCRSQQAHVFQSSFPSPLIIGKAAAKQSRFKSQRPLWLPPTSQIQAQNQATSATWRATWSATWSAPVAVVLAETTVPSRNRGCRMETRTSDSSGTKSTLQHPVLPTMSQGLAQAELACNHAAPVHVRCHCGRARIYSSLCLSENDAQAFSHSPLFQALEVDRMLVIMCDFSWSFHCTGSSDNPRLLLTHVAFHRCHCLPQRNAAWMAGECLFRATELHGKTE